MILKTELYIECIFDDNNRVLVVAFFSPANLDYSVKTLTSNLTLPMDLND